MDAPHCPFHRRREPLHQLLDPAFRDDERWRDHHQIAVGPVRLAHVGPDDEPFDLRRFGERLRELRRPREWRARGLVFHELDAGQEPTPPHVAHVRQTPERRKPPLQLPPDLGAPLHELVLLEVAYRREPGGARHRMVRRSEEHTSELQSQSNLVCRLLLEKKKKKKKKSDNKKKKKKKKK